MFHSPLPRRGDGGPGHPALRDVVSDDVDDGKKATLFGPGFLAKATCGG